MNTAERELRLKKIYLEALPGRLQELQEGMEALIEDEANEQQLNQLHRAVHNLAGSSSTYGFESLGDKAGELEEWVEAFVDSKTLPTEADQTQFQLHLRELEKISDGLKSTVAL